MSELTTHKGGCHCGAVAIEVDAPVEIEVQDCNCSMCGMTGFRHLIVPKSRFRLLSGAESLSEYTFNTGVARHLFCKTCGVKSFYVPRSNPDGFSVNVHCLDTSTFTRIEVEEFDGQNWDENAAALSHLSQE